ncbi:hypothetical protein, partial [Mesorhizobium sp.]|uniref:hypothetical protein n=1 Tax=Mesorhizobium sp. TaxID=1871066 RepID=UPI00258B6C1C
MATPSGKVRKSRYLLVLVCREERGRDVARTDIGSEAGSREIEMLPFHASMDPTLTLKRLD